jgi:hypothetical protein
VRDGILLVRIRARGEHGTDVRRFVLRRAHGRLHRRPAHARHPRCSGLIRYFALTRPVLGGRAGRTLRAVVQVGATSRVSFAVRRKGTVVRRFAARRVRRGGIVRRTIVPKGIRRGDVRVTVTVRSGASRRTATRTARRL